MIHSLCMMPTRDLRMMRGFLVMAHLMVFGGFLVIMRGVPILVSRFLVLRRSLGGHSLSSHKRLGHATTRFPPPQGVTPCTRSRVPSASRTSPGVAYKPISRVTRSSNGTRDNPQ
jgi:hypothetical protein